MDKWEMAKDELDCLDFPTDVGKEIDRSETHTVGKTQHALKSYESYLVPIRGFSVKAHYNYCPTCGEIRNKKLVIFNNDIGAGVCFIKDFIKHGRIITK